MNKKNLMLAGLIGLVVVGLAFAGNPGGRAPWSHPAKMPEVQVIAAGGIIAADACEAGLKRINSAGNVTTDTTNTFAARTSDSDGCVMHVVNIGANTITLDNNANFKSAAAGNVALGSKDSMIVAGVVDTDKVTRYWVQLGATGDN